jgi:hypothetical protein
MFTHFEQLGYLDFYTGLTGFAKLLVTTNFKFEKTSMYILDGSSAKKINTLLMR